jgi:hypothetical protein
MLRSAGSPLFADCPESNSDPQIKPTPQHRQNLFPNMVLSSSSQSLSTV